MVKTKSIDELELDELQKLASKGITEDEVEDVIAEYTEKVNEKTNQNTFEQLKEQYKREKTQSNFSQGVGGFKRS